MLTEHVITIDADGGVHFIYSDDLAPLLEMGAARVRRASHVEPTDDGHWEADMSPSGHTVKLGPYHTRQEALDAEVAWLYEHILRVENGPGF